MSKSLPGLLALGAALLAGAPAASAAGAPGSFTVFRSFDTGSAMPAQAQEACDGFFGGRPQVTRLDAMLFAPRADPAGGRVVDERAGSLGPGWICAAPATAAPDPFEALAGSELPGLGLEPADGTCAAYPLLAVPGGRLTACRLREQDTDAPRRTAAMVSNSLVTPAPSGLPTGSIWTVFTPGRRKPGRGAEHSSRPDPARTATTTEGLRLYVTEATDGRPAEDCRDSGGRSSSLAGAVIDPATGRVRLGAGTKEGRLEVCETGLTTTGEMIRGTARLAAAGGGWTDVEGAGECRTSSLTGLPARLRARSCVLEVAPDAAADIRGGQITGLTIVPASGDPDAQAPSVWTVLLVDA